MLDKYIKQKYLYNTPFDDDEMPYVVIKRNSRNGYHVSLKKLLTFEQEEFEKYLYHLKEQNIAEIIIDNDFINIENPMLKEAIKCYKLSLLYHFYKYGFSIFER